MSSNIVSNNKIGFWTVFAIVVSAQIGSAVLLQPAYLAKFGILSLAGLAIATIGAIALALMFSKLSTWVPKTGGPHAFAKEAFGDSAAFFTGWTYWIVSWVSSAAVVTAAVAYLLPLIGLSSSPIIKLTLGTIIVLVITAINFRGLSFAGHAEIVLWILKSIPLLIVPIAGLYFFNIKNFTISPEIASLGTTTILSSATIKILWGFVGLETATAAAGSVENPSKTIPRAVIFGTIFVALLYLINTIGIMGVIPGETLANSIAPYTDAAQFIFGGNWYLAISFISFIILFGTLNAWILTSGQISLGLAQDKLMPAIFAKKNKFDAPIWGLAISCIGTIALLILTSSETLAKQVEIIVTISVIAFLFVYAICCLAFFKLLLRNKKNFSENFTKILFPIFYGSLSLVFCLWMIYKAEINEILIASLFTLSGIPFYLHYRIKKNK